MRYNDFIKGFITSDEELNKKYGFVTTKGIKPKRSKKMINLKL